MNRAQAYLLILLLFIDAASVAALYLRHIGISPGPSVSTAPTCIWRAYVIEYPEGLGPWNTVLVAENTSTHVYYPVALLPWPLHRLRLWSSQPSSWETYKLALLRPKLYAAAKHPAPIKKTVYTWRRTRTWLAILPCKHRGYTREELGNFTILARSEPTKGDLAFLAIIRKNARKPINLIPLPLSTGWTHVLVYGYSNLIQRAKGPVSVQKLIGVIELPVTDSLLESLQCDIAGVVKLNRVSRGNGLPLGVSVARLDTNLLGIHFEPFRREVGAGLYGGAAPVTSFYVASNSINAVIVLGSDSPTPPPGIAPIRFSSKGHLDIVVSASLLHYLPYALLFVEANVSPVVIYSSTVPITSILADKPPRQCSGGLAGYEALVLANTVPIRSPGIVIPVYISAWRLMGIGTDSALWIEAGVSPKTPIEVLIDGLPICRGLGGCNATIRYPWIYPLMLETVISGEPLEVAILANESATLTSLKLVYGRWVCGSSEKVSPGRYLLIEPVDPQTLAPMGIIIVDTKAGRNKVHVEGETVGTFTITLKGAQIDPNHSLFEPYSFPPTRSLSTADRVLQPHINWIDDWEPFLSTINYALGNPLIVLTEDSTSFIYNKAYGAMTIAYKPRSTGIIAIITHQIPGIQNPVRITLRLR